jgi:hypothetical protein
MRNLGAARFKQIRSYVVALFAGGIALGCVTQAAGQPICRPNLWFEDVRFSQMQPPTLQRTWTAVLSVDASRCATGAGPFEILFFRLKESGPDLAFRQRFMWRLASVEISVDFWADETVELYEVDDVAACPCRSQ